MGTSLSSKLNRADFLHLEAFADMGNDADAGAVLGGGVRFRWLRLLRSRLGGRRLGRRRFGRRRFGWRGLGGRRIGRGSWRRLRQSRLRQRQRKPQGDSADHVSLRCKRQTGPAKLQPANRYRSIGRRRRIKMPAGRAHSYALRALGETAGDLFAVGKRPVAFFENASRSSTRISKTPPLDRRKLVCAEGRSFMISFPASRARGS